MEKLKLGSDYEERTREVPGRALRWWLFCAAALGAFFGLGAIFYVWLYVQQVQNGYRLSRDYENHEQLLATQRKLRLEWSRFQDPSYLEELGSRQFGLVPPKVDQKVLMR